MCALAVQGASLSRTRGSFGSTIAQFVRLSPSLEPYLVPADVARIQVVDPVMQEA
jgi:hypothetical protein